MEEQPECDGSVSLFHDLLAPARTVTCPFCDGMGFLVLVDRDDVTECQECYGRGAISAHRAQVLAE